MGRAKVTLKDWAPAWITAKFEKQAMDGLEKACEQIADRARSLCPVDTGTLRDTIRVRRLSGDPFLDVRVYAGSRIAGGGSKKGAERGAFYAHMVEFGTVKWPQSVPPKTGRRPFLRPALDSVKGNIISIITNEGGS